MGIVAAAADAEEMKDFGEAHAWLKGLDEGVTLASSWATMAKAFFKMSC